jgi:glycosyltransferase involved in cell wall biosynthesis
VKISYLITCHNEDTSLDKCITTLVTHKDDEDEILVLDDFSDNPKTQDILDRWKFAEKITMILPTGTIDKFPNIRVIQHALDKNYGGHKNFGNEQCTGNWIFQIDADETPNPNLIINLKIIIESNPNIELIFVPRINDYIGVTEEHAKQWGWTLTPCPACNNRLIVQWPDYQGRIFKRVPERIRWDRRLHEKIEGHSSFATLPAETDLALYHDKTIETQLKTNIRYNQWFTQEENQGHNVFGQKK